MTVLMYVKKLLLILQEELKNFVKHNIQMNLNYLIMLYIIKVHVIN